MTNTAVQLRMETLIEPGVTGWESKPKAFNDLVTDAVARLLRTSETFPRLVLSTKNAETVEGTMGDDFARAAIELRESVPAHSPIATATMHTLRKAMGLALRRMHLGRKQLPHYDVQYNAAA